MKRPFCGPPPDEDGESSRAAYERALQRYDAIAPITPGEAKYVEGRTLADQVRRVQEEGHPLKPSVQTLSAWRIAFLGAGRKVAALLDGQRGGAGTHRGPMADPDMQALVSECERALIQTSGREYPPIPLLRAKILGRVGAARADAVPRGKAIDRYRRKAIPLAERTFLAKGERGYLAERAPKPPADYGDRHGVMLVIDHRQADLRVRYGDRELRPWITAGTDPVSGACRSLVTSPVEPGSTEVGLAILDAIRQKAEDPEDLLCGIPEKFYSDMGQDLASFQIQAPLKELGVEKILAKGYSPWTRGSHEGNFNKTMAQSFEPGFGGYVGNSTNNRPRVPTKPLSYKEWAAAARRWALVDFNNLPYQKRRLNGQKATRLDFARANRAPLRMPDDDALLLALMKREKRTVAPNGISVGGTFLYWADALFSLAEERSEVEVRYDPADMSQVYIFHRGEFFCVATDARAAAAGATEKDNKERHRLRAQRVKALREATEPARMAAMSGDDYLEFMQREQIGEAQAVAAVAGQRPIRQLIPRLDRAAQQLRTGRVGRGSRPSPSRATNDDGWKNPYDRPITEEPA